MVGNFITVVMLDVTCVFAHNDLVPYPGALVMGGFYWSALTMGALTMWQVNVMGVTEGWDWFAQQDNLPFFLFGLPMIPCGLILFRMVRWEEYLLQMWRHHSTRWWILRKITGGDPTPEEDVKLSKIN